MRPRPGVIISCCCLGCRDGRFVVFWAGLTRVDRADGWPHCSPQTACTTLGSGFRSRSFIFFPSSSYPIAHHQAHSYNYTLIITLSHHISNTYAITSRLENGLSVSLAPLAVCRVLPLTQFQASGAIPMNKHAQSRNQLHNHGPSRVDQPYVIVIGETPHYA